MNAYEERRRLKDEAREAQEAAQVCVYVCVCVVVVCAAHEACEQ